MGHGNWLDNSWLVEWSNVERTSKFRVYTSQEEATQDGYSDNNHVPDTVLHWNKERQELTEVDIDYR